MVRYDSDSDRGGRTGCGSGRKRTEFEASHECPDERVSRTECSSPPVEKMKSLVR